jgi:hypothetical protein
MDKPFDLKQGECLKVKVEGDVGETPRVSSRWSLLLLTNSLRPIIISA